MSFISFLSTNLSKTWILFFSGLFLNFIPKKISNFMCLIYFLLFFLSLYFSIEIGPEQNLIETNISLWLSFSFFITFFALFSFKEKKDFLNDKKIDYGDSFLIFLYFILTREILFKIFLIQTDKSFNSSNLFLDSFFYFEFISLITFILFNLEPIKENFFKSFKEIQENKKKLTLRYLILHLFIGFIFLISIDVFRNFDSSLNFLSEKRFINFSEISDSFEFIRIYGIFIVLFINSALPLFSFWFIKTYSEFNFILFLIFSSGISKVSIILLLKSFGFIQIVQYIGIFSSILFLFFLIFENNIKRFVCLSVLSQNYFLLSLGGEILNLDLSQILLHSIISQGIFFLFILSLISFSRKEVEYFYELEFDKNFSKFLFFIGIFVSLIFIGFFGTPNFHLKKDYIEIFKNQNSLNNFLISIYKILSIIIFLFILPYKSFKKQKLKNNFITQPKNLFMIFILSFFFILYFFLFRDLFHYHNFDLFFKKLFYEFFLSLFLFFILKKTLLKLNFKSFISSDSIFEFIKLKIMLFISLFLFRFKKLFLRTKINFSNFKERFLNFIFSSNEGFSINSSGLYFLFFIMSVFFLIFIKIFFV